MSGSFISNAAFLLDKILNNVPELREKISQMDKCTRCEQVVNSIRLFISEKLNKVQKLDEKEALSVLLKACTYSLDTDTIDKNHLRELLGFTKKFFYTNLELDDEDEAGNYNHKKRKIRDRSEISKLQEMCIDEFCHSEESSNIDSNAAPRKIKKKDGTEEKHAARVWLVSTLNEQYTLLCESEIMHKYRTLYPEFKTPSRSFFYE